MSLKISLAMRSILRERKPLNQEIHETVKINIASPVLNDTIRDENGLEIVLIVFRNAKGLEVVALVVIANLIF